MSLRTELFQFDNYGINSFLFNTVSDRKFRENSYFSNLHKIKDLMQGEVKL